MDAGDGRSGVALGYSGPKPAGDDCERSGRACSAKEITAGDAWGSHGERGSITKSMEGEGSFFQPVKRFNTLLQNSVVHPSSIT